MNRRNFESQLLEELPAPAWLFELPSSGSGRCIHGSAVQILEDGIFEGCIDGDMWSDDLAEIGNVFGSGVQSRAGRHLIITPSHTLESIFIYEHDRGVGVSNSLALLLEFHRLKLPFSGFWGRKFASICLGIESYKRKLFSTAHGAVSRVTYDNVELPPGGGYRLVQKPEPPRFGNFGAYVEYLEGVLRKAFASATDASRNMKYAPLATCSSGYDSAASAALANRVGCSTAVTLRTSGDGEPDSGADVAKRLGLCLKEFDRPQRVAGAFQEVADFFAAGMGGEDYCYDAFSPILDRRVLLTGFHGDKVWDVHGKPNRVLERGDVSGASLQEFRIRRNFLHIPLPMIGALRHAEIAAISKSDEMRPYRLHNDYDRPIPRRILEDAGVPREIFGQKKKAASMLLFSDPDLLGRVAREESERLVTKGYAGTASYLWSALDWNTRYRGSNVLARVGRWLPRRQRLQMRDLLIGDWRIFEHSHPRTSVDFSAGIEYVRRRYRAALQGLDRSASSKQASQSYPPARFNHNTGAIAANAVTARRTMGDDIVY